MYYIQNNYVFIFNFFFLIRTVIKMLMHFCVCIYTCKHQNYAIVLWVLIVLDGNRHNCVLLLRENLVKALGIRWCEFMTILVLRAITSIFCREKNRKLRKGVILVCFDWFMLDDRVTTCHLTYLASFF